MNATFWLELAAIIFGSGGIATGGTAAITRLTRLAIAVENVSDKVVEAGKITAALAAQVQQHENRLNKANVP
jgi:hypothetical protein